MKLAIDSIQREIDALQARSKRYEEDIMDLQVRLNSYKSGHADDLRAIRELELAIEALIDAKSTTLGVKRTIARAAFCGLPDKK